METPQKRVLRLHPQAKRDIDRIYADTATHWSTAQAESYLRKVNEALELICVYPWSAREIHDISPSVRAYPVGSHIVLYRPTGNFLDVIRIVHYRQNWRVLFEG